MSDGIRLVDRQGMDMWVFDPQGADVTGEVLVPGVQYRIAFQWVPPAAPAEIRRMHTEYHRRKR